MATSDAPATVTELQTDFLQSAKEVTGVTAVNTVVLRYLNRANQEIHAGERWPWQERRSVIETHPGYSTGTVAIALATRTTVTGTGTLWDTAVTGMGFDNARAGGKLTFDGAQDVYQVSAVGGDTAITLVDRWIGATALTAATYQYYEDEYALAADFDDLTDARYFTEDRKITIIGPRDFYRAYARNSRRGAPVVATLIELGPGATATLRRRVLFGPAPDQTYTLPYRYWTTNLAVSSAGVGAANLSASTDEPIIPLRFRQALVRKALELWARDRKDDGRADVYRGESDAILVKARAQVGDASHRPRLTPAVAGYWRRARRPWSPTSTGRRYDLGDGRFESLEI